MKIHREGKKIILIGLGITVAIWAVMLFFVNNWTVYHYIFLSALLLFFLAVVAFGLSRFTSLG